MNTIKSSLFFLVNKLNRSEMKKILAGSNEGVFGTSQCRANYAGCTCAELIDGSWKCTNCCLC